METLNDELLNGMTLGNDLITWTFKPHNTKKIYYIENTETLNGDTMSFWKHGNCGYTTNLNQAITLEEDHEIIKNIIRDQKMGIKKYRLWNVDYLRKVAILSLNIETIDLNEEVNEEIKGE
jgi:hypothetical protein